MRSTRKRKRDEMSNTEHQEHDFNQGSNAPNAKKRLSDCPVCHNAITDTVGRVDCGHCFCFQCINYWCIS